MINLNTPELVATRMQFKQRNEEKKMAIKNAPKKVKLTKQQKLDLAYKK